MTRQASGCGFVVDDVTLRLRRLVAETVGIAAAQLTAGRSLTDDLAVHWLDLLELALTIEEQLDVSLPDALLEGVHTYGDLEALVVDRRRHPPGTADAPLLARLRVVPSDPAVGRLTRVLVLTPYGVETIVADARRFGRGTRVHLDLPATTHEPALAALRSTLSLLVANGISVRVSRDPGWRQ
jgi:acyl carrier protein